MSDVKWFNPRQIPKKDLLVLETGRKYLVNQLLYSIEKNLSKDGPNIQWLVTGTRGAGKSFFLRYAQLKIEQKYSKEEKGQTVKVILLPEELENVYSPHELLDAVRHMLKDELPVNSSWNNNSPEEEWKKSLSLLLDTFTEDLLIIAIENFGNVLKIAFKDEVHASLLRKLLTQQSRIMLLVSDVEGTFDKNYRKRLFEQFEHHNIKPWNKKNHRSYLKKRAKLEGMTVSSKQLAKIDAYSRYTGGNPRVAAILATTILHEDNFITASKDLNASLDKVSDYYRALLGQLPSRSRQLFHAFINGKEPCSQSELAKRVGATQSQISQAFKVLNDLGYLQSKKIKGKKAIYYQVVDRLFVQWYRMRHIQPDENSHLAIMANLLTEIIDFKIKLKHAQRLFDEGQEQDAHFLIDMALQESRIDISKLTDSLPSKIETGKHLTEFESLTKNFKSNSMLLNTIYIAKKYNDDKKLKDFITEAKKIILCQENSSHTASSKEFIKLVENSFSLNIIEKIRVYCAATTQDFSRFQWDELTKVYREEQIKFKQLEIEHPDDIKKLEQKKANSIDYPWTSIWEEYQEYTQKGDLSEAEQDLIACSMIIMAVLNRKKNPNLPYIHDMNYNFERRLSRLRYKYGIDEELLVLLELFISKMSLNHKTTHIAMNFFLVLHSKDNYTLDIIEKYLSCTNISSKTKSILLKRKGWSCGIKQKWKLAFDSHLKSKKLNTKEDEAWNIGQAARHQFNLFGFEKAWSFLEPYLEEFKSEQKWIIQQLGDCLLDIQKEEGASAVYGVGRELLYQLSKKKDIDMQSIIRLLFIDAVDMKVSLNSLIDLARDLPEILQDTFSETELKELELLSKTLINWFKYLQLTPKERGEQNLLDPDWETTLKGLNKGIGIEARLHYKLTKKATIGKEAKEIFETICGLMDKFESRDDCM